MDKKPISARLPNKPKEAAVSVVNSNSYVKPTQQVTFQPNSNPDTPPTQQPAQQSNRIVRRQFTRIPIPLSQVLARLRADNLINFEVPKEGYRPRNYDPELKCDYHLGQVGHSTDNSWRLRHRIQDLIDAKLIQLDFVDAPHPNVATNPLPNHGHTINMITTEEPDLEIDLHELPITVE